MGAPSKVASSTFDRSKGGVHGNRTSKNNDIATSSPSNKVSLEETYTSLIQQYLQVMCLENATFLAERMVATSKTTNALYLLAVCHYRSNNPQRAQSVLEECKVSNPATQYLLAKCCFDMEQYGRAEEALLQQARADYREFKVSYSVTERAVGASLPSMDEWLLETSPCPVPNGAAGFHLLAKICRRSNRKQRAMQYYRMALQLDPLMWSSYEALCEMGALDVDPTSVFGVCPTALEQVQDQLHKQQTSLPSQNKPVLTPSFHYQYQHHTPTDGVKSFHSADLGTPTGSMPKTSLFQTGHKRTANNTSAVQFETPNLTPIPIQDASFAPGRGHGDEMDSGFLDSYNSNTILKAKHVAARLYYPPSPETPDSGHLPASRYLRGVSRNSLFSDTITDTPLRRGGRQDANSTVSTARKPRALFLTSENKTNNTEPELDHRDQPEMGHQQQQDQEKEKPNLTISTTEAGAEEDCDAVQEILEVLCLLGAAWWRLCQYRCREALQLFHLLPHAQHNTGWVLHQEGRAYFEMTDYPSAQRCLELMQQVEPHRMKGLELLSSVLWQLKKEVEIAHLAQKAVDFDRLSPEAWCVVGNCFALQKEHETALVFFSRSLQLDPTFTYTHTLSGYEYMANEDFDKAVACFRSAILVDERHYNAWYGLGAIYHRQEKYDLAEYHFHRAVAINPQSSVLRCNLGMSQYANGKPFQALDTLAEAFRLNPQNPQARFQRATIYVALNRPEEALKEFEKVLDAAPREAAIHFEMGKVFKRLGRRDQAMRCFLTALDLDPKDNQLIKSAMDKLDEPDVDEEVAAF